MGDDGKVEHPTITTELVEDLMRSSKRWRSDAKLLGFTVKAGAKKGDNYLSVVYAVQANIRTFGDEIDHFDIIIKVLPDDPVYQKMIVDLKAFEKEREAYLTLFPAMIAFQTKLSVPDVIKPPAPRYYTTKLDAGNDVVILENLQSDGYFMACKLRGLDYHHSSLVMKEMAKFHAVTHAMARQIEQSGRTVEDVYPCVEETFVKGAFADLMSQHYESTQIMATKAVREDANRPDLADRMAAAGDSAVISKRIVDILDDRGNLAVICHGDCWVNNMLFKYAPNTEDDQPIPTDVKFIDFQVLRYASPTLDLHYFLYTSTRTAMRRMYRDDLLRLYHSTLIKTLVQLGVTRADFTFERFMEKFVKDAYFGYIMACMVLPFIIARPEDTVEFNNLSEDQETMIEEMKQRMEEAGAKLKGNDAFLERLLGTVEDLAALGAI